MVAVPCVVNVIHPDKGLAAQLSYIAFNTTNLCTALGGYPFELLGSFRKAHTTLSVSLWGKLWQWEASSEKAAVR